MSEHLRIFSPGIRLVESDRLVEVADPGPVPSDAEAAKLPFEPYSAEFQRRRPLPSGGAIYWVPSTLSYVRSVGPEDKEPARVQEAERPKPPTDAEAMLLEYVPWHAGILDPVRKLPNGESIFRNLATGQFVRSRELGISEHPAFNPTTTTRRIQEHRAMVNKTLAIFRRHLWPKYSNDPVEVRIQENLRQVQATVWWGGDRWIIAARLTGDPKSDLSVLLHEAIHVGEGHAPKLDHLPPWVGLSGNVSESELLRQIRRRDQRGDFAYVTEREADTDRLAEAEIERIWPS